MACDCSLVQVPTLTAATHALAPWVAANDWVIAALDARRNDVFAAVHVRRSSGWSETIAAGPYDVDVLAERVSPSAETKTVWVTGPGAEKMAASLHEMEGRVRVVPTEDRRLSARHVATLGAKRGAAGQLADPRTVEPAYLKAFQGTPTAKRV